MIENISDKKEVFDEVFTIMKKSFPISEYREFQEQKSYFTDENVNSKYYNIAVKKDTSGKIIGFTAYWDFKDFIYIEHLAVDPLYRNNKIGEELLSFLKSICKDKKIILEVELPSEDLCKRRISFYKRNCFVYNDYDYLQPPLRKGQEPFPLKIMSYPSPISITDFNYIKDVLYKYVYNYKG